MNCNHYNLLTIILYQMSLGIPYQTLTEGQGRINVEIKTLLTMYALCTYVFLLVSLALSFFLESLFCMTYFSNRPFAPTKNDGRSLTKSIYFA